MASIEHEKRVVEQMIRIYCRYSEGNTELCNNCRLLLEYSHRRLEHCKYGNSKPSCKKCPVHCYKPAMRESIRRVMRYSGPRMLLHHPLSAIRHMLGI